MSAASILEVARLLGVRFKSNGGVERCGPCPVCGGDDRFSVNNTKGVFNCRQCNGRGDAIGLARFVTGMSYADALIFVGDQRAVDIDPRWRGVASSQTSSVRPISHTPNQKVVSEALREQARLAAATKVQAERIAHYVAGLKPLAGSPGERFLREVRKINTAPIYDVLERTDAIGWHSAVYFNKAGHPLHGERLGCIVGVMTDARTAAPTGAISRTYIGPDGCKIGKATTLGSPAGIIRLSSDEDVCQGLFLAEGLETALAGMSIGLRPMWSTGSTGVMAKFPPLAGIECLTLLADNDRNEVGQKAASVCGIAWREAGKQVRVFKREQVGDLNDALTGRCDEP